MMAYDDGLAIGIEFGQPRRDVAHRDVSRARKSRDRDLGGFANVEDKNALAAIDALLKGYRIYVSYFGQPTKCALAPRYGLISFENSSTFENGGSSVHETENPKVSLCPGWSGSKCGFSFRMRCVFSSSAILSAL